MCYAFCSPIGSLALNGRWVSKRGQEEETMKHDVIQKWLGWVVAAILAVQFYFVKEMLAAELMFAVAFIALAVGFAIFYGLGALGRPIIRAAESLAQSATRAVESGIQFLDPVNRRPFRQTHSQSVR